MSRSKTLLPALVALLFATTLQAQSPQSFQWSASVTITPSLNCSVTRNLDYGTHFATEGNLLSSASNYAELMCTTDPGNAFNVSFVLPSSLTRVGGGGSVPISYGVFSARLFDGAASESQFDPSTGITGYVSGSGTLALSLGRDVRGDTDDAVTVHLAGAPTGSYSGFITVTLAIQ